MSCQTFPSSNVTIKLTFHFCWTNVFIMQSCPIVKDRICHGNFQEPIKLSLWQSKKECNKCQQSWSHFAPNNLCVILLMTQNVSFLWQLARFLSKCSTASSEDYTVISMVHSSLDSANSTFLSTFQFKHFLSSSWQRWNKTKRAFSSPGLPQNGICLVFVFYVHQQQVLCINWDKRHQKICRCHLIHVCLSVGVYNNSELVMCWRR